MQLLPFIRLSLAAAALLLAACSSVPKAAPGYAVRFGPIDGPPPRVLAFPIRSTEVVPAPWLASTAMHYRLLYAQPTRRQVFVENRWAAHPGQLLELALKRSMKGDLPPAGAMGCRLRVDLDEFAQVFESEGVSRGVIELRAALLAPRSDQSIAMRSFSASVPAPSANAVGGVLALRDGVARVAMNCWIIRISTLVRPPRARPLRRVTQPRPADTCRRFQNQEENS
jgi:cholesterol transport system auxiliary component